jgi:hypothetical protein
LVYGRHDADREFLSQHLRRTPRLTSVVRAAIAALALRIIHASDSVSRDFLRLLHGGGIDSPTCRIVERSTLRWRHCSDIGCGGRAPSSGIRGYRFIPLRTGIGVAMATNHTKQDN